MGQSSVLVDDRAPDPLQQPERPDHGLRIPGPILLERTGEHLEQPHRVCAIRRVQLVRCRDILQRLAHLARRLRTGSPLYVYVTSAPSAFSTTWAAGT